MLFCFGLFALLLYYTVVANAECSYTYRHPSDQPIEARSLEYQRRGFRRCQYLIQLVSQHQQLRLNFTRLPGFGFVGFGVSATAVPPSASDSASPLPFPSSGPHGSLEEEEGWEEEEEDWRKIGGRGGSDEDGGGGGKVGKDRSSGGGGRTKSGGGGGDQSQRSRLLTSSSTTTTQRSAEAERGRNSGGGGGSRSTPTTPGQEEGRAMAGQGLGSAETPRSKTLSDGGDPRSASSVTTTVWPAELGRVEEEGGDGLDIVGGAEGGGGSRDPPPPCLPMLEIRTVDREGREEMLHRICHRQHHRHLQPPPRRSNGSPHHHRGSVAAAAAATAQQRQREQAETQYMTPPLVFQSSSSVRIVYQWAAGHSSGFTLFFHFTNNLPLDTQRHQPPPLERCVHTCDSATRCLSERHMLCDGRDDCRDGSDENSPLCHLSTSPSVSHPLDGESLVQMVVIPLSAVAVVVVLSAVCLVGRRYQQWQWLGGGGGGGGLVAGGGNHSQQEGGGGGMMLHRGGGGGHGQHHHHRGSGITTPLSSCLQSHNSCSESSVTRACSAQECKEQEVTLLPSRNNSHHHHHHHRSHISWPPSSSPHPHHSLHPPHSAPPHPGGAGRGAAPHIDLPPNIPVSPDGEEGYAASQMALRHPRYHASSHAADMLFRPPPNKTVFDRESPPPYSVSPSSPTGGRGSYACRSAPPCPSPVGGGDRGWSGHGQGGVGRSLVGRCRSMMSSVSLSDHRAHPSVVKGGGAPRFSGGRGASVDPAPPSTPSPPDPQRQPLLFHGACSRKTDTPSFPPSSPAVEPLSQAAVPISCSSPSSPSAVSSSLSSSSVFSSSVPCSPAALLPSLSSSPSSLGGVAVVVASSSSSSRTTTTAAWLSACQSARQGVGQDRDNNNSGDGGGGGNNNNSGGGGGHDGSDQDRPPASPHPARQQLGASPPPPPSSLLRARARGS